MVVAHATKNPFALVPISGEIGVEISRCFEIYTTRYDGEHETSHGTRMMRLTKNLQEQMWKN